MKQADVWLQNPRFTNMPKPDVRFPNGSSILAYSGTISNNEGIDDGNTGLREINAVSRSDRQTVDDGGRCDETILDGHRFSGSARLRQQFRPLQPRVRIPGKTMETPGPCIKPTLQRRPLLSFGKNKNAETQFTENDGIDGDVSLVRAKPMHNQRIRSWFRRLAQNVRVNQILHRVSVDSESMGTKKSLCGQASSQ